MSPRKLEKSFSPVYSIELIRIAEGDFKSARGLLKVGEGRPENVAFLCHQSIEKCLKAVLIKHGTAVPLVHDLGVLIAKIPESISIPFGYELIEYNEFATIRRYEEGEIKLTTEELQKLVMLSEEILDWCKKFVGTQ